MTQIRVANFDGINWCLTLALALALDLALTLTLALTLGLRCFAMQLLVLGQKVAAGENFGAC